MTAPVREHPDKGGNVDAFIQAKRELDRLRE